MEQWAPSMYDVVWSVALLAAVALMFIALRVLWTSRWATGGVGALWFLAVLCLPVLGPLLFLAVDRARVRWTRSTTIAQPLEP